MTSIPRWKGKVGMESGLSLIGLESGTSRKIPGYLVS